jgi:hypothetical protein
MQEFLQMCQPESLRQAIIKASLEIINEVSRNMYLTYHAPVAAMIHADMVYAELERKAVKLQEFREFLIKLNVRGGLLHEIFPILVDNTEKIAVAMKTRELELKLCDSIQDGVERAVYQAYRHVLRVCVGSCFTHSEGDPRGGR